MMKCLKALQVFLRINTPNKVIILLHDGTTCFLQITETVLCVGKTTHGSRRKGLSYGDRQHGFVKN